MFSNVYRKEKIYESSSYRHVCFRLAYIFYLKNIIILKNNNCSFRNMKRIKLYYINIKLILFIFSTSNTYTAYEYNDSTWYLVFLGCNSKSKNQNNKTEKLNTAMRNNIEKYKYLKI